jgi:hypothetical protein
MRPISYNRTVCVSVEAMLRQCRRKAFIRAVKTLILPHSGIHTAGTLYAGHGGKLCIEGPFYLWINLI